MNEYLTQYSFDIVPGRKILGLDDNYIWELGCAGNWCETTAEKTTAGKSIIPISDHLSILDITTGKGEGAGEVESLHFPEKEESLPEASQKEEDSQVAFDTFDTFEH